MWNTDVYVSGFFFFPLNCTQAVLLMDGKFHWTLLNKCCSMTMYHFVYCCTIPGSSSVYSVFHFLPGSTWIHMGSHRVLRFPPSTTTWIGSSKLFQKMNVCVHGALWCIGLPSRVFSCSGSTTTLTWKHLLKMGKWINKWVNKIAGRVEVKMS